MGNCLGFSLGDRDTEQQWAEREQEPPQHYQEQVPLATSHLPPDQPYLATQMTHQQWNRVAQLIRVQQHLPREAYTLEVDGEKGDVPECVICYLDLTCGDEVRHLPCKHVFHADCIDQWLMRASTCPCCRDEVDEALPATQTT